MQHNWIKFCSLNICSLRGLEANQAEQWFLLHGPESSAGLGDRLALTPLLPSPHREHHNTAQTEIHLTEKLADEVLGKCLSFLKCISFSQISPFSSSLEGKGFLFFPQTRMTVQKKSLAAALRIIYIYFRVQCSDVLHLNQPKEYRAETLEGQPWCSNHIQGLIC